MPKVTMFIRADEATSRFLLEFDMNKAGLVIRQLVADAVSTEGTAFDVRDVDFLPTIYPPGTQVANPISIEIETIGYHDRKAKLTEKVVRSLKSSIIDILTEDPELLTLDEREPLIWLKFQDPEGYHI